MLYLKLLRLFLFVVCFYFQNIYGLLTVLFFLGAQATFFGPIKYSLLPEHLADDDLISGNGLIEDGTFLSIFLGTLFGGLIIITEHGNLKLSICIIEISIVGWLNSRAILKSPIGVFHLYSWVRNPEVNDIRISTEDSNWVENLYTRKEVSHIR